MSQTALADYDWDEFIEQLQIEDDEPVDNIISAKQMRLLVETLYSSWQPTDEETGEPRQFFADANIGIFYSRYQPAIVPDVLLSLDVAADPDFFQKKNRSYFVWEFGKVPEVAVEIVSNKVGNEATTKFKRYADLAVSYYVLFDPLRLLGDDVLRVYELGFGGRRYLLRKDQALPNVGLNLTLWSGEFETFKFEWLRWTNQNGELLLTGRERADQEKSRFEQERARADEEKLLADEEKLRAETAEEQAAKLAARLRELGVDPTTV